MGYLSPYPIFGSLTLQILHKIPVIHENQVNYYILREYNLYSALSIGNRIKSFTQFQLIESAGLCNEQSI